MALAPAPLVYSGYSDNVPVYLCHSIYAFSAPYIREDAARPLALFLPVGPFCSPNLDKEAHAACGWEDVTHSIRISVNNQRNLHLVLG